MLVSIIFDEQMNVVKDPVDFRVLNVSISPAFNNSVVVSIDEEVCWFGGCTEE